MVIFEAPEDAAPFSTEPGELIEALLSGEFFTDGKEIFLLREGTSEFS